MSTGDEIGFVVFALVIGFIGGCTIRGLGTVDKSELGKSGYVVHAYKSSKDGVETNWVEVVRTDGRPL